MESVRPHVRACTNSCVNKVMDTIFLYICVYTAIIIQAMYEEKMRVPPWTIKPVRIQFVHVYTN